MRFGKRNRAWTVAGRRIFGDREGDDTEDSSQDETLEKGGVATEERNALLGLSPNDEVDSVEEARPAENMMGGDPTQHLLTALGRFQRQVAKGEGGAPQELWTDECINQLITGIKIAYTQGWDGIREALTDTARILQTYEEAGQAQLGIPFLQDSYEILCLMVGDLIVDNVRSGVMQKWRDRFERAVRELDRTGLRLIEDEEAEEMQEDSPVDEVEDFFGEEPAAAPSVEEIESVSPKTELAEAKKASTSANDDWFNMSTESTEEVPVSEVDEDEPSIAEEEEAAVDAAPAGEDQDGFLVFDAISETEEVSPFDVPEETSALDKDDTLDPPFLDIPEEVKEGVEAAPVLDEIFPPAPDIPDKAVEQEEPSLFLYEESTEAPTDMEIESKAPEDLMELEEAPVPEPAAEAEFAFGIETEAHMPPEPMPEPEAESVQESLLDLAEVPVSTSTEEPHSPEALLRTAQQAMARGDVADAKMLALRLAAQMAQLEAERSLEEVRAAEAQLESYDRLIATAEEEVRHSREALQAAEGNIGVRQSEFDAKRQHTGLLRERAAETERSIANLDDQIRALEEQRKAEMGLLSEIHAELEDALASESRVQTELDGLSEAEQYARDSLEAAQSDVERHHIARATQEAVIATAREEYERRCRSAEDIENTITVLGGAKRVTAE